MRQGSRRIDHVVVAVRDLESVGAFYHRLGFQVGARNRHPWGTENRLVQFGSSFIELVTVGEDPAAIPPHADERFSFGAFVRDYLRDREGLAMLALDSDDAAADSRSFAAAGLERSRLFRFERAARRPDGSATRVAFSLAFASGREGRCSLFVCQQHFPENFWNPAFQLHPNGATAIGAATMSAAAPEDQVPLLSTFTGSPATRTPARMSFDLRGGRLDVVRGEGEPALIAFSVRVPALDRGTRLLDEAGVPFHVAGDRATIRSIDAFGVEIVFDAGSEASSTEGFARPGMIR